MFSFHKLKKTAKKVSRQRKTFFHLDSKRGFHLQTMIFDCQGSQRWVVNVVVYGIQSHLWRFTSRTCESDAVSEAEICRVIVQFNDVHL